MRRSSMLCKVFFLNTLSISEKTMRSSLQKLQPTGVVEPERIGGRHQNRIEQDKKQTDDIKAHINKFDRI